MTLRAAADLLAEADPLCEVQWAPEWRACCPTVTTSTTTTTTATMNQCLEKPTSSLLLLLQAEVVPHSQKQNLKMTENGVEAPCGKSAVRRSPSCKANSRAFRPYNRPGPDPGTLRGSRRFWGDRNFAAGGAPRLTALSKTKRDSILEIICCR